MKKKIAILCDDFPPNIRGGAGAVAGNDAAELAKRGFEVLAITTVQDKALAGSFNENGVRVERIFAPAYHPRLRAWVSLNNRPVVQAAGKILAEFSPDMVHAHNIHEYISYAILSTAKSTGARVFLTAHDVMLFHYGKLDKPQRVGAFEQLCEYRFWYNPFRNAYIQSALKNVDQIFAVSNALKQALEVNGIQKVKVMYNGIDSAVWECSEEASQSFVQKHSLEGKDVVLFGGRISGAKGGDVMLKALPLIVASVPNAVLVIAGKETEYVRKLIDDANVAGIQDHLYCAGWLSHDDMCAAYHASRVVVVPSQYLDPFPTVVLEAMASARPVVGQAAGGIPDMVIDGETGYLIEGAAQERANEYALATTKLLKNPELRTNIGTAALNRVKDEFSLDAHISALIAEYSK